MLRRTFLAGLGLAAVVAAVGATTDIASAQFRAGRPGQWVLLGTQKVGFHVDRDVVRVGSGDNRFRAIKIRVHGNDIEMIDLKVVYGNGQTDDFPVRHFIRQGGETRAIELRGGTRRIREVQMTYKSKPSFKGQATAEVWGQH